MPTLLAPLVGLALPFGGVAYGMCVLHLFVYVFVCLLSFVSIVLGFYLCALVFSLPKMLLKTVQCRIVHCKFVSLTKFSLVLVSFLQQGWIESIDASEFQWTS